MNASPAIQRLFNASLEATVLGALLISGTNGRADQLALACGVLNDGDFTTDDHLALWQVIAERVKGGKLIDPVTVGIEAAGRIKTALLFEVIQSVPSDLLLMDYVEKLKALTSKRNIYQICHRAQLAVLGEEHTPGVIIQGATSELAACASGESAIVSIGQCGEAAIAAMSNPQTLIKTGLQSIDQMIEGFAPGEYWIIGGRPSMGKSALMKTMAVWIAKAGVPILIASLEETPEKLGRNFLSQLSSVESNKLRGGNQTEENYRMIEAAQQQLAALPITVAPKLSTVGQVAGAIAAAAVGGCKVAFVDYLQLVQAPGKSRYESITEVSLGLARVARQVGVCVVALAQLNRASLGKTDKRPDLGDLKESGQIEQDADGVIFVHRPGYYDPAEDATKCEVIIGKAREASRGQIGLLRADFAYQRFKAAPTNWTVDQGPATDQATPAHPW